MGDIIKMDQEGRRSVLIYHHQCPLAFHRALVADSESRGYCMDSNSTKIMVCGEGGEVQVKQIQQDVGPGRNGVALYAECLFICEWHYKSAIAVYDKDLHYVRQFKCDSNMGEFFDISADCHGNFYVTDFGKSCIRVFTNNGIFQRSFGLNGDGLCVCV